MIYYNYIVYLKKKKLMTILKKTLTALCFTFLVISCKTEVEQTNQESQDILINALIELEVNKMITDEEHDEIIEKYKVKKEEHPMLGYQYSIRMRQKAETRTIPVFNTKPKKQKEEEVEKKQKEDKEKVEEAEHLSETEIIHNKIKDFAERKYPTDTEMQLYTYNEQVKAFNYMVTVKDNEVLEFAERKYPYDYSMQKYTYNNQLSDKRYMKAVKDNEILEFAKRKYLYDYSMQKYTYDNQLSDKRYMENATTNEKAKEKAKRKYPRDYSMQKYTYENIAF